MDDSYLTDYFKDIEKIAQRLDLEEIERAVSALSFARDNGFGVKVVGLGGSAANASHFVTDLRKLCGVRAECLTDNIGEFTAWANDSSLDDSFANMIRSNQQPRDTILVVLSVGGGDLVRGVSVSLLNAMRTAHELGLTIISIVGRTEGYAAKFSDVTIIVPEVNSTYVTPYSESFQSVVCHAIVFHPKMLKGKPTW